MRSTTKPSAARLNAVLLSVLLLYGVASFVHFAHNAELLTAYPNLPGWLTSSKIYLAWLCVTVLGVLGYLLFRSKHQGLGFCLLTVYALLGLDGLVHYTRAPLLAHTAAMNFTIWFEVAAAASVLAALGAVAAARLLRWRGQHW
jgi:predicted branched-subunit amino acid permease